MRATPSPPGAVILGSSFPVLGFARSLARRDVEVCVAGSTTGVARCSRSVSRFAGLPRNLPDDRLVDYLLDLAARFSLRGWLLFPSSDAHLRIVAQNHSLLAKHYLLTTPAWETVKQLYDKRLTYALARQVGLPIPRSHVPHSADHLAGLEIKFPVVLKPAISHHFLEPTRVKAYRADHRAELHRRFAQMARVIDPAEIIVQELLPEPARNLFSFGGYFKNGKAVAGLSVKRSRQFPHDFGRTSTFVEVVQLPQLREWSNRLLSALGYTGLAEVEFMWDDQAACYKLLDVNARLWAWQSLADAAGLNLPYLAYADALGLPLEIGTVRPGIKWIRLATDLRMATHEIAAQRLTLRQYLGSLGGPKTYAVFAANDPFPALAEPVLRLIDWFQQPAGTF